MKAFSEGRDSIKDEPRSRRTATEITDENVPRNLELVYFVRMIGEDLNLTHKRPSDFDQWIGEEENLLEIIPKNLPQGQNFL